MTNETRCLAEKKKLCTSILSSSLLHYGPNLVVLCETFGGSINFPLQSIETSAVMWIGKQGGYNQLYSVFIFRFKNIKLPFFLWCIK